jgi:hypothetical protein
MVDSAMIGVAGWRIGLPAPGFGLTVPAELTLQADLALAAAVLIAAVLVVGQVRRVGERAGLRSRLDRLEAALAGIDKVTALSFEIEDRYGARSGVAESEVPVVLALRRDMALTMAEARAAVEAHGALSDVDLAEEALLIAMRPVIESPATLGDGPRSLERLRSVLVRLRLDVEVAAAEVRRRLGYRTLRRPKRG